MTAHPLIGKVVRWSHGPNVLVGPATRYDEMDDELFIVPDGLMHGHYWVPAAECVEASVLAEQGEPSDAAVQKFRTLIREEIDRREEYAEAHGYPAFQDEHSAFIDGAEWMCSALRADAGVGIVRQVLVWINTTLALPVYQEPFSEIAEAVVLTLKTVRKMLDGTSRPDASWRTTPSVHPDAMTEYDLSSGGK